MHKKHQMTLNDELLSVYFHMNNHYRKLRNVKSSINSRHSADNYRNTNPDSTVRSEKPNNARPPTRRNPKDMPKNRSKSSPKGGASEDKDKKAVHETKSEKKHEKKAKPYEIQEKILTDTLYNAGTVSQHEYLHFSLRITEDIIKNDLYTNAQMKQVFNSHLEANRGRLDGPQMTLAIGELCKELNIPLDDTIGMSNKEALTTARVKLCTKSTSQICICSNDKIVESCVCGSPRQPPIPCALHPGGNKQDFIACPNGQNIIISSCSIDKICKPNCNPKIDEHKNRENENKIDNEIMIENKGSNLRKDIKISYDVLKIKDSYTNKKPDLSTKQDIYVSKSAKSLKSTISKMPELEYIKKPKELCRCGSPNCIPSDCEEDSGLVELEAIITKTNLAVVEQIKNKIGSHEEINASEVNSAFDPLEAEIETIKDNDSNEVVKCCDSVNCIPTSCAGNVENTKIAEQVIGSDNVKNKGKVTVTTTIDDKIGQIPADNSVIVPINLSVQTKSQVFSPEIEPVSKVDCKCGVDDIATYLEYFNKQNIPTKHLRQLEITSFSASIEPKLINKSSESHRRDKKEMSHLSRRNCCCGSSTENVDGFVNKDRVMEETRIPTENIEYRTDNKTKNICHVKNQEYQPHSARTIKIAESCARGITQEEIDYNSNNYILLEGPVYVPRQLIEKNMSFSSKGEITKCNIRTAVTPEKKSINNINLKLPPYVEQAPVKLLMDSYKFDSKNNRCDCDMTPQREYVNNQSNVQYNAHCQSKCVMSRNTDLLLGNQYIKNCNNSMANIAHFYPTIATQVSSSELLKYATEINNEIKQRKPSPTNSDKIILRTKFKTARAVDKIRQDVRKSNPQQPLNTMSDNKFVDIISSYQVIEPRIAKRSTITSEEPSESSTLDAPSDEQLLANINKELNQPLLHRKPSSMTATRDDVLLKLDRIPPLILTNSMDSNVRNLTENLEKYRHGEENAAQVPRTPHDDKIKRASISQEVELINIQNRDEDDTIKTIDGKYKDVDQEWDKQKHPLRKQSTFLPTSEDGNKKFANNIRSATDESRKMSEVSAQVYAIRQKNK